MTGYITYYRGVGIRCVFEALDGVSYAHFELPEKFGSVHPFEVVPIRGESTAIASGKHTVSGDSHDQVILIAKDMIDRYLDR
ncbi:MAG TPA: hypothetical protein VL997_15525 [Dyella sp.]|nr:hypothetical protein [Dyella sp.]